jgi:23S rRNA (adenine2503-C2)-methyltransferase
MEIKNVLYLPSGRIFIIDCDGYVIESTEMRDVAIQGKVHSEVRTTNDPKIIWKHLVPFRDKWLLTVSTQKGCTHNCKFCDVADLKFKGNLSQQQIEDQVSLLLKNSNYVNESSKVKIGFARMGEPAHNLDNVLRAICNLPKISEGLGRNFKWLPCFNSILPNIKRDVISDVIAVKEEAYNGFLHFQISCNSTDEDIRRDLFGGADVMTIESIVDQVNKSSITNRTVTLNFIVMEGVEVDVIKLKKMGLNKDKFTVKLIPLNNTIKSEEEGLKTFANYNNYEDLIELKNNFEKENIPVVIDAIARCEEAGLCCGQLAQIFQ